MTTSSSHYIHGSTSEEQSRLSLLNDILNQTYLEKIKPQGANRILDVGCGLGQFSRLMAKAAGNATVIGIERDLAQIERAQQLAKDDNENHLLNIRQGEVADFPLNKMNGAVLTSLMDDFY